MPSADHDARDGLERDMANHEARFNGEVHASRNQVLAAEALQQLDRERAETPQVIAPEPLAHAPIEPTVTSHELNGQRYKVDVAPDKTPMYRTATEFEHHVLRHAQPRIDMLLTKQDEGPFGTPSWRVRTIAALYFKIKSHEAFTSGKADEADVYERCFQQDLYELLEASNQPFGDWRKSVPAKPLIIT